MLDQTTDTPKIRFTDSAGTRKEIQCEILVGADGSRGICKWSIPQEQRVDNFVEYPFAWFGILCEAPPSADELIYCNSEHGFALISQRDDHIQRMYFQCPPDEDVDELDRGADLGRSCRRRVDGPDGFQLKRGQIFDKMVLRFRSYVCEPLRYGNLFLAGDAGHTVPPTGAKGLNLAFADVRVLFEGIESFGVDRLARAPRLLQRPGAAADLEGAELLVLDDDHAAHRARTRTRSNASASSASWRASSTPVTARRTWPRPTPGGRTPDRRRQGTDRQRSQARAADRCRAPKTGIATTAVDGPGHPVHRIARPDVSLVVCGLQPRTGLAHPGTAARADRYRVPLEPWFRQS